MACSASLTAGRRPEVRKVVTVVFTDLCGSTAIGEALDPEAVRNVMSRYFEALSRVFERHGGTVEKFIGDAVMAVFGTPSVHEDDPLRAVRAAAELPAALDRLNAELERDLDVRLAVRTGVNTGEVVAGDPATGQSLVTGDAVNVAARLEQAAEPGEVLIGDATYRQVPAAVEVERVEPLALKGKREAVAAWRLLDVAATAPAFGRRLDAPMLGRDGELAQLRQSFERVARKRTAHVFTVLGEAGVGKSRLASELVSAVEHEASVFVGRCLPYGEGITFWPLAEIVRQALGEDPRARIAELLAGEKDAELIADRVAAAIGMAEASAGAGEETFWAVRKLCQALARERPLVLVFDDIHWAEPALLDLIEHLADWTRDAPLLLLCLARPELVEDRPGWAGGKLNASSMLLDPLSESESQALIDNLLGSAALPENARAQLVETTEGNPLFLEQTLALLREQGEIGDRLVVPPTIQALLAARLERLEPGERALVERASVVGKEFWQEAVSALTPEGERGQLDDRLMTLVRKELIRPGRSALSGEDVFQFRHILIRDAAYKSVPKRTRAELHERFAAWVEGAYPEEVIEHEEILGYHLEQAYRHRAELGTLDEQALDLAGRAAARLGSAGRRAFEREDMTAVVNLVSRSGALLPAGARERLELSLLLGEALDATGNHGEAEAVLSELVEAATASGERCIASHAIALRTSVRYLTQPERRAAEFVDDLSGAIAVFDELAYHQGLAEAWGLLGDIRVAQGHAADGQKALERAFAEAGRDGSFRREAPIIAGLARCLLEGPTHLDNVIRSGEEWLRFARQNRSRTVEGLVLQVLGVAEGRRGRFAEGRSLLRSSSAISEELGLSYMTAMLKFSSGELELAAGEAEAAESELRFSYRVFEELGAKSSLADVAGLLAEATYAQGRYDEAERFSEICEQAAPGYAVVCQVWWRTPRAKLLATRGQAEEGDRLVREAVSLAKGTDFVCLQADALLALSEALRLSDRAPDARPAALEALRLSETKGYAVAERRAGALLEELGQPAVR